MLRTVYELFPPRMREKIKLALKAHGHAASRLDGLKARDHALGKKRLDHIAEATTRVMAGAGVTSLRGLSCLEFGAGYVPTEALIFHLLGARSSVATDYNAIAHFDHLVTAARAAERSRVLDLLGPYADGIDVERRLDFIVRTEPADANAYIAKHIAYVAPYDMSKAPISPPFDFIHSISVFEHLPVELAGTILTNLIGSLVPGGKMISEIDLRDHRDLEGAPLAFLSKADDYNQAIDFDLRGNALRRSDWLEMFEKQDGVMTHQIYEKVLSRVFLPKDISQETLGKDSEDVLVSWVGLFLRGPLRAYREPSPAGSSDSGLPMTVSICVPAYNAERTLEDTLCSIVAQTYRDLDIAVVDNASTDATPEIIRRFAAQDSRVRHVRFEELVNGHANFTRCFSIARNELMAIYHSDDMYHPRIVEEQAALFQQRPDIGAVFVKGRKVDGDGKPWPEPYPIPDAIFSGNYAEFDFATALRAVLQYGNIFLTPSAMARTAIYRDEIKIWPFPKFGGAADLFVFLSIAKAHKIAILNKTLMDYRVSDTSSSFHYARERRTKHDIFQPLDYFIANEGASIMRPRDFANYEFFQLKDDTNLAISLLIDGDCSYARKLMPRLLQPRIIAAALRYRRHARFLFFGYCAWLLSFMPLGRAGRKALNRFRFG